MEAYNCFVTSHFKIRHFNNCQTKHL